MTRKHMQVTSHTPHQPAAVVAAVVASFLMLIFGFGYRVLAARLSAHGIATPLSPGAFERLPLQIGEWTGHDVSLDEAVARATDADAHVNRRYSRRKGLGSVSLYVAGGVRARDLMPHRPEVCYTGAGWTLTDRRSAELPLSDQPGLPCNVFEFSRGALNAEKVVVLNYYIIDGQYCQDVSLLRSKAWRGSGTVRYVVLVQIVVPIAGNQTVDSAEETVCAFAVESASSIAKLCESFEEAQSQDKDRVQPDVVLEGAGSD